MRLPEDLAGTFDDHRDTPEWAPLEELLGEELAGWFMWMCPLRLEDGTAVHAYKHVTTRRYLHLGEDGRVFWYTAEGNYRPQAPRAAIEQAFTNWDEYTPWRDEAERTQMRAALDAVLRDAPVDVW